MKQLVCACRILSYSAIRGLEFHERHVFVVKSVFIDTLVILHAASVCPGVHSLFEFIHLKVGPPRVAIPAEIFFEENVELVLIDLELHPLVLVIETLDDIRQCQENICTRVIIVSVDRRLRPDDQVVVEHGPRTIDGYTALRGGRLDVIAF